MASLTIRKLDDELRDLLRQRAASNGVSMEEEARRALHSWVHRVPEGGLGSRLRRRFAGLDAAETEVSSRSHESRPLPEIFDEDQ
jgi:plasmid stability protein